MMPADLVMGRPGQFYTSSMSARIMVDLDVAERDRIQTGSSAVVSHGYEAAASSVLLGMTVRPSSCMCLTYPTPTLKNHLPFMHTTRPRTLRSCHHHVLVQLRCPVLCF